MKKIKERFVGIRFINTYKKEHLTTFTVIPTFGYFVTLFNVVIVFQFLFFTFKIAFKKNVENK